MSTKDKVTDNAKSSLVLMQPLWYLLHWQNYPSTVYTNQRKYDRKTNANGGDNTYTRATTQGLFHRPKNCPHKNWSGNNHEGD